MTVALPPAEERSPGRQWESWTRPASKPLAGRRRVGRTPVRRRASRTLGAQRQRHRRRVIRWGCRRLQPSGRVIRWGRSLRCSSGCRELRRRSAKRRRRGCGTVNGRRFRWRRWLLQVVDPALHRLLRVSRSLLQIVEKTHLSVPLVDASCPAHSIGATSDRSPFPRRIVSVKRGGFDARCVARDRCSPEQATELPARQIDLADEHRECQHGLVRRSARSG